MQKNTKKKYKLPPKAKYINKYKNESKKSNGILKNVEKSNKNQK